MTEPDRHSHPRSRPRPRRTTPILPFEVAGARSARPRGAARPGGRHHPARAMTIRRRWPSCWARRSCSRCCSAPSLKFEGRFILQTQTDGPVRMLVVDFTHARQGARLRALRRRPRRGRHRGRQDRCRRAARPRPSRHDHRPGPRHEPLPGPGRARRQAISKTPRTNISCAPSRSRPACGSRSARNSAPAPAARSIAGAPAAFCCSSCRRRRSARASPISIPATRRKASSRMWCRRTMPGSKAARWSRRSRTSN